MKIAKLKIENLAFALLVLLLAFANVARASTGYLDSSAQNVVKICKDVTCGNPLPGLIDFKLGPPDQQIVVDTVEGISGMAWGGKLGWINFNSDKGNVYFADAATGLLTGNAWSETSGFINFAVTGQKVFIDPQTGEFNGWAWASGPDGGWIKFDCQDTYYCVRTTWRPVAPGMTANVLDSLANNSTNLLNQVTSVMSNIGNILLKIYNTVIPYLINGTTSLLEQVKNIFQSFSKLLLGNVQNAVGSWKIHPHTNNFSVRVNNYQPEKTTPTKVGTGTKTNQENLFLKDLQNKSNNFFGTILKK